MTVYIVLFATVLVASLLTRLKVIGLSKKEINGDKLFWFVVFVSFTLVEGLRDRSIGIDLDYYVDVFRGSSNIVLNKEFWFDFRAFEPGYRFLNYILVSISDNPRFFIFSSSLIIVFLHTYFLYKNSNDVPISIMLFLGFDYFFTSMVSLRQFIAMGIVFWCYPAALSKDYKKYFIIALLAAFFHQSSLICSVIILLAVLFKKQKRYLKWIFAVAMFLLPMVDSVAKFTASFFRKYDSFYMAGSFSSEGIGKLRIIYIIMEVILVIYSMIKHKDDRDERMTSMAILIMVGIYLGVASSVIPYAFRLSFYFDYFILLFIPDMIKEDSKNVKIWRIGAIMVSIVFYAYYLSANPGLTVPYEFYKG